ncbi:hypothetical protein DPMN_056445 [Dreissena polymorpha]|uniref:Uncharacterized protein n=1 Tax=Dreissena polymorpha TaxID=45954 RepID=A0A9D4CSJ2_DREPO|nr:hypothetical protein DPMN_056445 [Dreissena polymorpha]
MRKDMTYLMTSITATNQQLSEMASYNQKLISIHDNIDSHVKDVATGEVGRRTHLLRRGLDKFQEDVQSDMNRLIRTTDDFRV